jgi:hypothetical protein
MCRSSDRFNARQCSIVTSECKRGTAYIWAFPRHAPIHKARPRIFVYDRHPLAQHFSCPVLIPPAPSSAKSSANSYLAARRAPASCEIDKGPRGATLVDECVSAIHGCILRTPFTPCWRSNQLVYATYTTI